MNLPALFSAHPRDAVLRRFADNVSPERERERVSAHLAECSDCRADVAFARQIRTTARTLPDVPAPEGMLERIVAERAAGERIILPVEERTAASRSIVPRIAAIAALVLAAVGIYSWPVLDRPLVTARESEHPQTLDSSDATSPVSALAQMFAPAVAMAQPPDDPSVPPLANLDGTRLKPGQFTLTRRVTTNGETRVEGVAKISLDSVSYEGRPAWRVVRLATGPAVEAETVLVERKTLRPIGRLERVRPYVSYGEIVVRQRFTGDSVHGWMHTDRTFGRPIARRLNPKFGWYIPSEALAPFLLEATTLSPGWKASAAFVGWAVVPNDVFFRFTMEVVGEERITVPDGTFDCWRVAIHVGTTQVDHWVRKSDGLGIRTHRTEQPSGRVVDIVLGENR